MKKITFFISGYLLLMSQGVCQHFEIQVERIDWAPSVGLQSFAWASYKGKWLVIGGRTDGLHRRQPFAYLNLSGQNALLIVIDPVAKKKMDFAGE